VKELVVISGKGGTGKTSVVASFAALCPDKVVADCDVDAADLHLLLEPRIIDRGEFRGGKKARITDERCTGCGQCKELCRFDAVLEMSDGGIEAKEFRIDPIACEGCGVCAYFCLDEAIVLDEPVSGEWFVSETRHGPMVHARLGVTAENSGKLVSLVRRRARQEAQDRGLGLVIVDGAPGIGCPVIASVTGADRVLIVTEPTLSGRHDLERVASLTAHFRIPTAICVNKYDLNPEMASDIETLAREMNLGVLGRVRYDPAVTRAQIQKMSVVERTNSEVARDIRQVWKDISAELGLETPLS